jgi:hypothetical protein
MGQRQLRELLVDHSWAGVGCFPLSLAEYSTLRLPAALDQAD